MLVCISMYCTYMQPTLRMKPSGQVSWSYHIALYMSRSSKLVKKAKVMRIRPVIWAKTHVNKHTYKKARALRTRARRKDWRQQQTSPSVITSWFPSACIPQPQPHWLYIKIDNLTAPQKWRQNILITFWTVRSAFTKQVTTATTPSALPATLSETLSPTLSARPTSLKDGHNLG